MPSFGKFNLKPLLYGERDEMKGEINIQNPEQITAKIELTAPLKEWKLLQKSLEKLNNKGASPMWELKEMLKELVYDLEKQHINKYGKDKAI